MTDMILAVRITAEGAQLVGQLSAAQLEATKLKQSMSGAAAGTDEMARASDGAARASRTAAAEARSQAAAQVEVERAARRAAAEQRKQEQVVLSSLSRQKQGYQQVGFQAQDFFTQIASGTSPMQAFAQQSGQFAQALQIIGGEATGSKGKMAAFAGFLAGPWGIALGVALPLVALLASKLFETSDAAKAADDASADLTRRQTDLSNFFNLATGAIIEQNAALIQNAALKSQLRVDELIARRSERRREVGGIIRRAGEFRATGTETVIGPDGTPVQQTVYGRSNALADAVTRSDGTVEGLARAARRVARSNDIARGDARALSDLLATREVEERELAEQRARVRSFDRLALDPSLIQPERVPTRRRGADRSRQDRSAEVAARRQAAALERVREVGERAADSVARINDRWSEQPSLIQQANEATRDLNNIIRDAQERLQTKGLGASEVLALSEVISDARTGLAAVQEGLTRPFREMVENAQRQQDLQMLTVQGREREAEVLARVVQLQETGGVVTAAQREQIERIVDNEERINALLGKRDEIIGAYQQSLGDLRSNLEDLFSGGSIAEFGRNLLDNARRLRGRLLVEQLFGDGFRNLEQQVRRQTGLEGAVQLLDTQTRGAADAMESAGNAAQALANSLTAASGQAGAADSAIATTIARDTSQFLSDMQARIDAFDRAFGESMYVDDGSDIRVSGSPRTAPATSSEPEKGRAKLMTMNPNEYFREVARVLASPIIDQLTRLDETLGTRLAGRLGGVIQGGIEGYLTAGPVGGVLGALRGIEGLPKEFNVGLEKAFKGAQTGQQIDQLFGALGIKSSKTGAQLGGAIGGAIGGPVGEIVGSILGGITGGLLKSAKKGSATITNVTGDATVTGNNRAFEQQSAQLASSVQDTLANIAEQFGGQVGNFAVSLGVRDGNIRVDPSGRGITKTKKGAIDFGEDSEGALRAAILDAIGDGGITGISDKIRQALNSSKDLDRAVREALKVQQVEEIIGGLGSTLERQFRAFEAQAKDRVRIATQYGFDVTQIEARNAEDRTKLVDQILSDRVGSLQQLLQDFKFGDLFEGSAADRRAALIVERDKAKVDAEAGVDGAAQRLADLSRQLVETSREAYGTAGGEFATDRTEAISAAERVIQIENDRIREAQEATQATRVASEQTNTLLNESNDLLAQIAAQLGGLTGFGGEQIRQALIASGQVGRQVQP